MIVRKAEIQLELQDYIDGPPITPREMHRQACVADDATINAWRDTWIANVTANKAKYGSFGDNSIGKLFGLFRNLPVIVAGSGPSLKYNAAKLKDRGRMGLVSCLHNFHFMEDLGANVDLYVSLDAGPVTVEEVSEGGSKTPEEYWEISKDRTLACFHGTDPKLLEKWQGKVLFFNAPVPDEIFRETTDALEQFSTYVSTGGNVLGASTYISKVFLGANPIIFVGADFSFGYDVSTKTGKPKFHSWDSKYDIGIGNAVRVTDIFGNKVKTWPSYQNFKLWFDYITIQVPGLWINATEGGIFGAYPHGNIRQVTQMTLAQVFEMYSVSDMFRGQALTPGIKDQRVCF